MLETIQQKHLRLMILGSITVDCSSHRGRFLLTHSQSSKNCLHILWKSQTEPSQMTSGPHGESHHLREDLDLLDEVPDELVVVCQGITLAGLQLFAKGYMTIKFSLSCNAFAPSCAKCTP